VRSGDTVARLGGDEFAVLLDEIKSGQDGIIQVVDRVRAELKLPFEIGGHQTFANASIGSVLVDHTASRAEEVLRDADTAMYRAKATGRNRHIAFDPSMHQRVVEWLRVENDLRRAFERDELFLQYQPIVMMQTGAVVGFEALIRWRHPERGLVPPSEFISIAEETGIILALGGWMLERVCRQIGQWRGRYEPDLPFWVSINLSPKQFAQPTLADDVIAAIRAHGIPPKSLKLEITESAVMEDLERSCTVLARLRAFGVGIALDDFGVGYSSLGVLSRLPIDTLKVDRTFIGRISGVSNVSDTTILRSITSMARSLEMAVIAEGLEDRRLKEALQALGCDLAQGFAFARPLDAEEAAGMLDEQAAPSKGRRGVSADRAVRTPASGTPR
jgi:predicted signal transduction protein with EAL and GGDEF domain